MWRVLSPIEFINCFDPIVHMQFFIYVINMFANGFLADKESGGYFFIEHALGQEFQDLVLAVGEKADGLCLGGGGV